MALTKRNYVSGKTVITAENLNDIQDSIIALESNGGVGMGITGATVGQIAKIAAVDASGVPTAWSPADMPSGGGGSTVKLDTTLTQSGKAADAKAVGDALATMENKIPTASGGMSVTAADLLVTILRNAEYSTDQSDNITALATALNATPEPDIPDVPEGPDEPIVVRYAITNNLTECVNSNAATSLTEGASYTATLTASDGFVLDAVTVTMGGVDVTATVYADGVITIPSVTGDVVITASAVVVKTEELPFVSGQTYTVADLEVVNGNMFNGSGIISENSGFSYAIFPCRGANRAMFNSNIYSNYGVLMLDADKKYIRQVGRNTSDSLFVENKITFAEISRDAEYIMFQCRSSNMQNITLELYQDPEYNGVYELNTWYRIPWLVGYKVNTTTGVISEKANEMCSDYMSIYGATTIQISNGFRHFHVFYDADKNYLSTITVQGKTPVSYNIPDGATYLVIAPSDGAQHNNCSIRITE